MTKSIHWVFSIRSEWIRQGVFAYVWLRERQFPSQVVRWHAEALGEQTGTKLFPSGPISIRASPTWHGSVCRPEAVGMATGGMTGEGIRREERAQVTGSGETTHLHRPPGRHVSFFIIAMCFWNSLCIPKIWSFFHTITFEPICFVSK